MIPTARDLMETDYFRDLLPFSSPDWAGAAKDFQDRLAELRVSDEMTAGAISVSPGTEAPAIARLMDLACRVGDARPRLPADPPRPARCSIRPAGPPRVRRSRVHPIRSCDESTPTRRNR